MLSSYHRMKFCSICTVSRIAGFGIVMDLVALLGVGFAVLVTGTAISARMWSMIYHTA
jgi:hypothetical protein